MTHITYFDPKSSQSAWRGYWSTPHDRARMGVLQDEWTTHCYACMTFHVLINYNCPNFTCVHNKDKDGSRTKVDIMALEGIGKKNVFVCCLACKNRNWAAEDHVFFSYVEISDPNLPRLGKCSCVVCNGCVIDNIPSNINDITNARKGWIPCPYCNFNMAHQMDKVAWVMSRSILKDFQPT
jgi:hypothetical protein